MKNIFIILIFFFTTQYNANAQGCVAVRQMGGTGICGTSSYNLSKGDLQAGVNYRYFHSWRHFVGKVEQPGRQKTGGGHTADVKDRGNAVNIYSHAVDLNLSYVITNRLQFNLSIPWVHNERSQILRQATPVKDTFCYSLFAKGLGDVRFGLNYWVVDPAKAHNGSLMIGGGIKLSTGSYLKTDDAPQTVGTTKTVMMDQAI